MWHRLQVAWIVTSECFSSIWTKKSLRIYSVRGGSMITTPWSKKKSDSYRDNSEWGRFFRDLISARFDEAVFAVDYAEQLFSEELEP